MGYFSNGSEGMDYEARFCDHCVHQDNEKGCPVMNLHWLWNYEACDDETKKTALDELIPRKDIWNDQCLMFKPKVEVL